MCGRFTLTTDRITVIQKKFQAELTDLSGAVLPRYNVAPGQSILAVIADKDGKRRLINVLWGFRPPWTEKGGRPILQANLRDDTIRRNKFYLGRLVEARCIIVADGFYEWKKPPGFEHLARGERLPKGVRKIPYRIVLKNRDLFSLAGLWRGVEEPTGRVVSAGIVTTQPNSLMQPIHDRMPVLLSDEDLVPWLDPSLRDVELLSSLLDPYPSDEMEVYPVAEVVNSSRNESPECIQPVIHS